ncbi:MAG TPA: hypothetical protein VF837_03915, partial [Patescibacteria group bacterium]
MLKVRMNPLLMLAINFVIAIALFSFFKAIGWFQVTDTMPLWATVAIVGVINVFVGFVVGILLLLATPLVAIVACLTLGLGMLLLGPAVSYATLWGTASITGLFTMTTIWWQALVIGLAFGWLKLAPPS